MTNDEILTKKQVSELLQCSTRQIEHLVNGNKLPKPTYVGASSPRWLKSQILAMFASSTVSRDSKQIDC